MLFGLPFIVAGIAIGLFLYFPSMSQWWFARNWEEVPCWIETAELKSSRSSKGSTSYGVAASYRYEFDRRTHHSDVVSFYSGSDNIGDFQHDAFRQIQAFKGKDRLFRCFVNPAKPEQAVLFRDLRWGLLLMMSIFPTIFPLVGFMVSIGGWLQSRKARDESQRIAQHPGEPWRWQPEWTGETIHAAKDGLPFILGVAVWILVVQLPLALAVVLGGEIAKSALALAALLPAALVLIPLRFAWQRLQTRRAIGHPSLKLKQLPLSSGQALEGELRFDRALSTLISINVRVLCQRHITRRSGNSTSTSKETIWEHTATLSATEARRELSSVAMPLRIDIPRGLPCAVVGDTAFVAHDNEKHVWTMEVNSTQGGKPAVLPLPVFASEAEAHAVESATHEPAASIFLSTDEFASRLKSVRVHAEFDSNGTPTLLVCPAGQTWS